MKDPIDMSAAYISKAIKSACPPDRTDVDAEVMEYALSLITNMILTTALILVIGHLTHNFLETSVTLLVFAILRVTLKGFHLKSLSLCVLVTTLIVTCSSHLYFSGITNCVLMFVCILIVAIKSTPKKKIKIIMICLMTLNIYFQYEYVLSGCLAYVTTLLPMKGGERS